MRLIVNLPAFNEEAKIGNTIRRIPRVLGSVDEILVQVIDDGSRDQTAAIAREAGADFVYSNGVNRGIGKTFRYAVESALANGADIMVNIDADGQFDPLDIEKLVRPVLSGQADLVSADRFSYHKAKNIPWIKDFLNRFAAGTIGRFMNTKISDLTCGFRAYSRETLLRLNLPGDYTYTQEVIIDALGKNLKVLWIPVEVTYFEGRESRVVKSIVSYVSNSSRIILKAVRDVRPMKFFGIPGLFLIALSLAVFIGFLFFYFQDFKISPYRNYLLFSAVTFLIGLQFFVFSLIADMIKSNRKLTEDLMYLMKKEKYKK
ncbi:MAG: Glycosyl transferase family 2 [Candidatus Magasanikbacteria bacterium GW2011_GWA2_45_39]|uniref:Glycosyl transferase family 2 n=1 Tax=Candidatus Magasanikbacteria bacterium GW2011_GWA2_45_39 TaxID=1619041 RepID=A0A0G1MEP1_9BACT|nr:MAG: Glycosyl transferase family 2 [Candidatus Magasanikbacteria bacterium GW2011_GWA2_45_39]